MASFEGTKKDIKEDKLMAKKKGMSMRNWEKSPADAKHDKQKSMKGLSKGGVTGKAMKAVGRNMARAKNQRGS